MLFQKFRDRFQYIPVNLQYLQLWEWPDLTVPHPPHYVFLVARAQEVLTFLQRHLLEDDFGRDDYRELCELIIKYLGGQVSEVI